jgi:hypothetical protein
MLVDVHSMLCPSLPPSIALDSPLHTHLFLPIEEEEEKKMDASSRSIIENLNSHNIT